jgi:hypothetical protein
MMQVDFWAHCDIDLRGQVERGMLYTMRGRPMRELIRLPPWRISEWHAVILKGGKQQ